MSRRLRAFVLVLSLLWQPLSALLPAAIETRAEQLTHAVVHGQALGHHHHDDASLHLEAGEEVAHQHVPDGGQPPGLPAWLTGLDEALASTEVSSANVPMPPSADLEKLLRPPRPLVA